LVYYHAKVFRFLTVVRSPDSLQQFLVRQRLPLLSDEKGIWPSSAPAYADRAARSLAIVVCYHQTL
jgi:hypothetical protein